MSDDEHAELDFDPLDDTKLWPQDQFPFLPVGKMVLNRNPENYHAEIEQAAFGTGVLVDGLDFSDDKMLQGRTFSYSDTQRYRVGANYLQLPVNAPKKRVATNQYGGAMDRKVEHVPNPHINYEPSVLGGVKEAEQVTPDHEPAYNDKVMKAPIDRTNNYGQAGETYRSFEDWEREELINNLGDALSVCDPRIQEEMIHHFTQADEDYGRRVRENMEAKIQAMKEMKDNGPKVYGKPAASKVAQAAASKGHEADPY